MQRDDATIILQKYIRSAQARDNYYIQTLPATQQTQYKSFILGNDPEIKGLEQFKAQGQIAFVGTSGLRSILLACQLGKENIIPKLIIIDNSEFVYAFWKSLKEYFLNNTNQDQFLWGLKDFLEKNEPIFLQPSNFNQIAYFFRQLFISYSFEHIKTMVDSAVILQQGWENKDTFVKLKNILTHIGIDDVIFYPSNIVAYCYEDDPHLAQKILENIADFNPRLCIHTDMINGVPIKFFLVTNHHPEMISKELCNIPSVENIKGSARRYLSSSFPLLFNILSPHQQLAHSMKNLLAMLKVKGNTLLQRIEEKDYARALRIAANDSSNGLVLASLILDFKFDLEIDINAQAGEAQNAAIHFAALKNNFKLYVLLISHGANSDVPNKDGLIPSIYFSNPSNTNKL